jgi:hypothetical protein
MRVCLIALFAPDLTVPTEISDVANTFSAAGWTVHIADASRRGLRAALDDGPYDLAWFAGHAGEDGFALSDAVWRPAECGRWLLAVRAWMLVANACFSAEHVLRIQQVANVDVVATIVPSGVEDGDAAETALFLARALVESSNLATATHQASAAGQLQYRFFPGDSMTQSGRATGDGQAQDDVAALVRAIRGDPFTGSPGLIATVATLVITVQALTASIDGYRSATDLRLAALERQREQRVAMSPRALLLLLASALVLASLMLALIVRLGGA